MTFITWLEAQGLARQAPPKRKRDPVDDVKEAAVVVGLAVVVLAVIAAAALPAFGLLIQLWSGRWPW